MDDIISGGRDAGGPVIGGSPNGSVQGSGEAEKAVEHADPAAAQAPAEPEWTPLTVFTGSGWELFKIQLVNAVFTILTLGVYSFWGKARVRRYMWGNTAVLGEPLEYTGTGGELFRSFLLVMLLMFVGMTAFYACSMFFPLAASLALYLALIPLGHFATYQALRYRLSRTRWRGIRGNMDGSPFRYAAAGTGYSLLTFATLFVCLPLQTARMTVRRCNASLFGSRRFRFSGGSGPLFLSWMQTYVLVGIVLAVALFLAYRFVEGAAAGPDDPDVLAGSILMALVVFAPLAGVMSVIYRAAVVRWLFGHLEYGGVRFDASAYTARRLLCLTVTNGLLLLVTLGFAHPWTEMRSLRLLFSHLRYAGDPELGGLLQDTLPERSGGEGLLDALDMDIAI